MIEKAGTVIEKAGTVDLHRLAFEIYPRLPSGCVIMTRKAARQTSVRRVKVHAQTSFFNTAAAAGERPGQFSYKGANHETDY